MIYVRQSNRRCRGFHRQLQLHYNFTKTYASLRKSMAKDWYIRQNEKVFGPIAPDKLKALVSEGKVTRQAEVANEKTGPWHPITKLNGLAFPNAQVPSSPKTIEQPPKKTSHSQQTFSPSSPALSAQSIPQPTSAYQPSIAMPQNIQPFAALASPAPQRSTTSDTRALLHYQANAKSAGIAYALWFFLGMLGAHRFYSGKTGGAVAQLLITLISIPLCLVLIGFLTIFANAIWVLIDVFLISGWIRDSNSRLANLVAP